MALVFKDVELDLSKVPDTDKSTVKKKVADILYNEILRHVSKGQTPVSGESNFKQLTTEYAKNEKQGNRTPNLQLEGDLLRTDLKAKALDGRDVIRVGHFNPLTADTQGEKADGHNQHSLKAKIWASGKNFPKRKYIPEASQNFKAAIMNKIDRTIARYEVQEGDLLAKALEQGLKDVLGGRTSVSVQSDTREATTVSLDEVLDDDFLAELIGERLDAL